MDIVDRLKQVESDVSGENRKAINDAWHDILWMREVVQLSKRAVEIAEANDAGRRAAGLTPNDE